MASGSIEVKFGQKPYRLQASAAHYQHGIPPMTATTSQPPTITTSSPLSAATVGSAYSTQLAASGGTPPYTWSKSSSTPGTGGFPSCSSSGLVTGTPSTAETESLVIQVSDRALHTASKTFSLLVNPAPANYNPWYKQAWDAGGSLGAVASYITGSGIQQVFNSNTIAGPFGETQVLKVSTFKNPADSNRGYFGGTLASAANVTLNNGDDTWVRFYHYFPSAFCAGTDGSSGDWDGTIKWFRYQFASNGSRRLTYKMGGIANGSCSTTSASPKMQGAAMEVMASGTNNDYLSSPVSVPRDQWVALQWHIHHDQTIGASKVEMWIGSTYCGAVSPLLCSTFPAVSSDSIVFVLGDYWNGGSAAGNSWYISNAIFTKQTPTTLDSGGRPYISPTARISDFP
jgi:hypothetical protein